MPQYEVTYSMNVLYSTTVEASDEKEAIEKVNRGEVGKDSDTIESEFLGANTAELIE